MSERVLKRTTFSGRLLVREQEEEEEQKFRTLVKGVIFMFLDIAIALGVSASLFLWFTGKGISPTEQPFPCGDVGIQKPFKENTVGLKHLLVVSLASPLAIIVIVEALVFSALKGTNRTANFFSTSTIIYLKYLLVYAGCTFAMEYFKCFFGRLRPHFVDICKPDWSKVDCSNPDSLISPDELVCTNPNARKIRTARTSFPSGHTAAAVHVCIFVVIYVYRMAARTKIPGVITFRNIIIPVFTIWTIITAITRVTDNWHHPTDVLGGAILAIVFIVPAFYNSWTNVSDILASRNLEPIDDKKNE